MADGAQGGSYEPSSYVDDYPDYRNSGQFTNSSFVTPYPSQYSADQMEMPQPRMPSPPPPLPTSQQPYADPFSYNNQGRLNDAVASVVSNTDASAYLAPDVISQITATVIQQLKAYGLNNMQGQQSQQNLQSVSPPLNAPDSSPSVANRVIHTPPSEMHDYDASPPLATRTALPVKGMSSVAYPPERRESPGSQLSDSGSKDTRPKPPVRAATSGEITTLEKIWGKLFEDDKPTTRLSQFLRGIAVHLVR
jgi:hypothetical protein